MFLIPGYGAQGGTAKELGPAFGPGGKGAIVNAARSIFYAFPADADDWEAYVQKALLNAKAELADVAGM
jgi:orotidine-5'-phosphate decarboxylase